MVWVAKEGYERLDWAAPIWCALTSDMQHQLSSRRACVERKMGRLFSDGGAWGWWDVPAARCALFAALGGWQARLPLPALRHASSSAAAAAAAATQQLQVDAHPQGGSPGVGAGAPHLRHHLVHAELHQPSLCICCRPGSERPAVGVALICRAALPALAARPAAAAAGRGRQRAGAWGAAGGGCRCRTAGDAEPAELPLRSWPARRVWPRRRCQLQGAAAAALSRAATPSAAAAADFEGGAAGRHPECRAAPVGVHGRQPLRIGLPPVFQRRGALEGEAHVCGQCKAAAHTGGSKRGPRSFLLRSYSHIMLCTMPNTCAPATQPPAARTCVRLQHGAERLLEQRERSAGGVQLKTVVPRVGH